MESRSQMPVDRLQKIIANAGIASRRRAEALIMAGRVTVNGAVITKLGTKADGEKDHIKVDGKLIHRKERDVYLILNKPKGYITTLDDPQGRPAVTDLLRGVKGRVYPVGRLDYNSEGLIFFTNDGNLAHRLTHPSRGVRKTYLVKVDGQLTDEEMTEIKNGVKLEDGLTAPASIRKIRRTDENSWVEMTIHEGRKRQIRRMFERIGHPVMKLKRIRMGSLELGDLPSGSYRFLTIDELRSLKRITAG
ncbi:MAG: pseudouridine synthase [Nitrospirota bacterium]